MNRLVTRATVWIRSRSTLALLLLAACHPHDAQFPWAAAVKPASAEHAQVRSANPGYDRLHSHVLVRSITRATRANLDYAAYHANFMLAEPAPESGAASAGPPPAAASTPFGGLLDSSTFSADIGKTALSASERRQPLAFAPLSEFLLASKTPGAERLEDLGAAVRAETWGHAATAGIATQSIAEVLLHHLPQGSAELWVKIEFAPWFHALGELPDQDHDGVPELYARAQPDLLNAPLLALIEHEYAGRELDPAAIRAWANQLASYWYPSFNTDLVPPSATWPEAHTEAEITHELQGHSYSAPSIVLRGKPQGRPTYAVFLIQGSAQPGAPAQASPSASSTAVELPHTQPTPDTKPIIADIAKELAQSGTASWQAWAQSLSEFHSALRKRNLAIRGKVQALAGRDGFLFYRKSLAYVAGGDLTAQPPGKNPLPIIVEYQRQLAALGVDFLFVPVPDKLEIYPDELDPRFGPLAGRIVDPWTRKLLQALAEQGVESLDLLTPLLNERGRHDADQTEALFQHQDTHWTARGLELAAGLIAQRIARYPWYPALARHARPLQTRDTSFTRFGDLHSRLPDALQKHYRPETLPAHQVTDAQGHPYDDDPDSPIVVLGDSFTGVYELTDAEHAGLSAHIAKNISYPVDLVMSYGGGPNVRNKLMRRGTTALASKRLVVWVMTARDLYDYWEAWEPLKLR